jgi:RimJ/RimL family protein N-acetyltransferase
LAHQALHIVLQVAKEMGYVRVWGVIAVHNTAMLSLARRLGFTLCPDADDVTLVDAEIDLVTLPPCDIPKSQNLSPKSHSPEGNWSRQV